MIVHLDFKDLAIAMREVIRALRNNLNLADNFRGRLLTVADTGGANVEFIVDHNLDLIPTWYVYNIDRAGIVYDSRRVDWTTRQMFLKCSVANAALVLVVM